ncbi:MAG TPA: VOC family protein [Nocardioides sp.]|nr:VOC family protein [Nocardioides sp.]
MDQRISLVTLAVADLDATRRFYLDGLGWEAFMDVPDDVLMIQAGQHLLLSFWIEPHFEAEVGAIRRGDGVAPITIAHNLAGDAEVDAVLETARAAGADPVQPAVKREWGGYSGYFGDPDGYRWEIAHAPGVIKELVVPQ